MQSKWICIDNAFLSNFKTMQKYKTHHQIVLIFFCKLLKDNDDDDLLVSQLYHKMCVAV